MDIPPFLKSWRFWRLTAFAGIVLLVVLSGTGFWVACHPAAILKWVGAAMGQKLEMSKAEFTSLQSIEITDLHIGSMARIDKLTITATPLQLAQGELEEIRVQGADIRLSEVTKKNAGKQVTATVAKAENSSSTRFLIHRLILNDIHIIVDNLGPGLPPITIRLAEVPPAIVLDNIVLGGSKNDPSLKQNQTAAIYNFSIYSPYDPLSKVISFDEIDLTFSWQGLRQNEIQKIRFYRPQIFIGPDLFWFIDQMSRKKTPNTAPPTPWRIHAIDVEKGQLIVSTDGEASLRIPGEFNGEMRDIYSDFEDLQLKSKFHTEIPFLDYSARYGVKLKNVHASLEFNLPPSDKSVHNLVRVFQADELDWKGLKFGDGSKNPVWLEMTFDRTGIYGRFGAPGLHGYMNGGVATYFEKDMPWMAWGSAQDVDIKPVTDLLSPEDFKMNGSVRGDFQVLGKSREIDGFNGTIQLNHPGVMLIPAAQQMLDRIPQNWSTLKKDFAKIPVDAFKRFDYTQGACTFSYMPPESYLFLNLDGLQGKRRFDIRWKDLRPESLSLFLPEQATAHLQP